ncbi:MAG: hypothetical protein EPN82_01705 [Bacteroidetes bacterium]|nr:MAG: hypothetical protein EPN82_01705 [Bacteroidota bacterium]
MKKKNVRIDHRSVLVFALFVFAILFGGLPHQVKSQYQPQDSCLKMMWPNDYDVLTNTGSYNPDSIKTDSCDGSPTFGKQFAKGYFMLQFQPYYYPFDKVLKPDTIKEVSDISISKNDLKLEFQQLEKFIKI